MASVVGFKSTVIEDLPVELLQNIFSRLDLEPLTLVSKQFCHFSSLFIRKLTFAVVPSDEDAFRRLFQRFPSVTSIGINCLQIDSVLLATTRSSLNLEELQLGLAQYPDDQTLTRLSKSTNIIGNIKSLQVAWFVDSETAEVRQDQVVEFIEFFPSLTELDLYCEWWWNDAGIQRVTSKLPNLRKISLKGRDSLTEKTLDALSSNCLNLESVCLEGRYQFTPKAVNNFLRNNPRLVSLDMPTFFPIPLVGELVECMQFAKNLNHFSLRHSTVDDEILKALAESRPPLKSLRLVKPHSKFTVAGLSELTTACPGLERLDIEFCRSISSATEDEKMSRIVQRLPYLKHFRIRSNFTCLATLFSLVQSCPLLETIILERKSGSKDTCNPPQATLTKNYSIRSIEVSPKSYIWLRTTVKIYCPNLRN